MGTVSTKASTPRESQEATAAPSAADPERARQATSVPPGAAEREVSSIAPAAMPVAPPPTADEPHRLPESALMALYLVALGAGTLWLVYDPSATRPWVEAEHAQAAAAAHVHGEAQATLPADPSPAPARRLEQPPPRALQPRPTLGPFNRVAAVEAIGVVSDAARSCPPMSLARIDARITVSPSGNASAVRLEPPWVEATAAGRCLTEAASRLSVPAFSGDPVTVSVTLDAPRQAAHDLPSTRSQPRKEASDTQKADPYHRW